MRLLLVVAALVCAPVFALPAVKPAQGYSAQVATDWFDGRLGKDRRADQRGNDQQQAHYGAFQASTPRTRSTT